MAGKMFEYEYIGHLNGRKVLLETPSGFGMFLVFEFVFKEEKNNIWVLFSDPEYAIQALVALGFRKFDNRSIARNCNDGPGKDLAPLITKFCKPGEELIVQDKELKASIEKNLKITCICDGYIVGELMWGIKNVLHKFIREEACNITPEYCLPVSEGLQDALRYYLVNIPPTKLDKSFISRFGFLRYLDLKLETYPKELLRSFDEYVGIGETVEDGLDYVKVLASVLVPELVEKYGFSKTFSPELASKLHQAKIHQAERGDDLTMADIEKIMGTLKYLMNVPEQRDKILMDVKLMEVIFFRSDLSELQKAEEPVDFDNREFRKVLLQTPSGYAIFNVREEVFTSPHENIWRYFTDIMDARNVVFALGFVRVEHYVVRDSVIGPGDKLRQLIRRFCKANEELVVQDSELKAVIESKLDVKCWTGDEAVDELIWGLKHFLSDFIAEEKDKLTDEYFFPMSKQLLRDLETYKINISPSKGTSKVLHGICDPYVSWIGGMEDDGLMYACRIAKVVIPGSETEIELAKLADGLGSKQIDVPKDAGKTITDYDKQGILQCLERLLRMYKQRKLAQHHLNKLLLGMMTIEDKIGVTGTAVGSEDDKQSTILGVRGKDETPDVVKMIGSLSVEAVGKNDGTRFVNE